MTRREAAIVSAYTGYLVGDFTDLHNYAAQLMERPIWAHELANKDLAAEISRRAKPDFVAIEIDGSPDEYDSGIPVLVHPAT